MQACGIKIIGRFEIFCETHHPKNNSDLRTVFVHVEPQKITPAVVCPILTVTLVVHAVEVLVALIAGLAAVDQHVAGVLVALVSFGPVLAPLVIVPASRRLECCCRLRCGPHSELRSGRHSCAGRYDSTSTDIGILIRVTVVESVDLPHIRVREPVSLSYRTGTSLHNFDRLQTPGLNTAVKIMFKKIILFTLANAQLG